MIRADNDYSNKKFAPNAESAPRNSNMLKDTPTRHIEAALVVFSEKNREGARKQFEEQDGAPKTLDLARTATQELSPEERQNCELINERRCGVAYNEEKASDAPLSTRTDDVVPSKHLPSPPRRPMSAFLAYSNKRRAALKRKNPQATNADLSRMLSKSWKELPQDVRSKYTEEASKLRENYKNEMAQWRKQAKRAEIDEYKARKLQSGKELAQSQRYNTEHSRMDPNASLPHKDGAKNAFHLEASPQQGTTNKVASYVPMMMKQSNRLSPTLHTTLTRNIPSTGAGQFLLLNKHSLPLSCTTDTYLQQVYDNVAMIQAASQNRLLLAAQRYVGQSIVDSSRHTVIGTPPETRREDGLLENFLFRHTNMLNLQLCHQGFADIVNGGNSTLDKTHP